MNTAVVILICSAIGAAVGLLFFAVLWLTVRRIGDSRHPAGLALGSALLRFSLLIGGFAGAAIYGGIAGALSALALFLVVRTVILRLARRPAVEPLGMEDRVR